MTGRLQGSRLVGIPLVSAVAVCLVFGLDAFYRRGLPLPISGPVDWLAHVATTGLMLVALCPRASRSFAVAALLSTVLIDLDHLPHILVSFVIGREAPGHGLWLFHTLLALGVASVIGLGRLGPARHWWLGIAFGLGTHLVRNAASGEGIPAFLPLSTQRIAAPYEIYAVVLVATLAITLRREAARRRTTSSAPLTGQ